MLFPLTRFIENDMGEIQRLGNQYEYSSQGKSNGSSSTVLTQPLCKLPLFISLTSGIVEFISHLAIIFSLRTV